MASAASEFVVPDVPVMEMSLDSQRAVMSLCGPPLVRSEHGTSFVSQVERHSGFYSSTIGNRGADPQAVIAQALRVQAEVGSPHFVWAPANSPLGVACWQQGLPVAYSLAVMATVRTQPAEHRAGAVGVLEVNDHRTAELFREVHVAQFATAPDPTALVEHFAADRVLLDPSIHAVVLVKDDEPVAAGYLHTGGQVCGLYWIGCVPHRRNRGYGSTVTAALLGGAPPGAPIVLQATRQGRSVYRRHGFHDHGLVSCWVVGE